MARAIGKSAPRQRPSGDRKYLSPDEPLILTVYLRHRLPVRRRPGSAVDLAELTKRVTLGKLRLERQRILKRSVERVLRFPSNST